MGVKKIIYSPLYSIKKTYIPTYTIWTMKYCVKTKGLCSTTWHTQKKSLRNKIFYFHSFVNWSFIFQNILVTWLSTYVHLTTLCFVWGIFQLKTLKLTTSTKYYSGIQLWAITIQLFPFNNLQFLFPTLCIYIS